MPRNATTLARAVPDYTRDAPRCPPWPRRDEVNAAVEACMRGLGAKRMIEVDATAGILVRLVDDPGVVWRLACHFDQMLQIWGEVIGVESDFDALWHFAPGSPGRVRRFTGGEWCFVESAPVTPEEVRPDLTE